MKHFLLLVISFMFLTLGSAFASDTVAKTDGDGDSSSRCCGLDFTYSGPEVFFTEPEVLKLSVIWEILNCYAWHHGRTVNQCENLEFYVVSPGPGGDVAFTSILESTGCLVNDDACTTKVRLPLSSILAPADYERYLMGLVVYKDLRLHMAFGGEEDQFGRIVGRKLACPYYDIRIVLNGTGFGSVAVISLERVVP
ncbi:MAG: hypothetical protein A2X86_14350 [Bdellovibrionales bacterium GWA2_49_15]|nr:MAG: hypothetical protein A2X86_14350 [Bdellovibrionales bacterium GWA2_49_15]HAZ13851.1 hypothetical protein [Bdellovibrionales bacterium]